MLLEGGSGWVVNSKKKQRKGGKIKEEKKREWSQISRKEREIQK